MKRKCYLCESDEARICFPSDKRQLRRWVFLLKCQVTLPNQAYSFCISKKLCRRSYLFNASSPPFQAPPRVGNSGPRLCLKHFHKEDIVDTRTGVKLKKNACPQSTTSIPGASLVTNDMILVSSDGFHIPTNISVIISVSPILKNILSDFHYQTYEESTKIILPEYDAETINTFLELINIGDVCVERSNMKAVRSLLSSLCINQDINFTINPIDDVSEYISRYSHSPNASGSDSDQEAEVSSGEEKESLEHSVSEKKNVECPFQDCQATFRTTLFFWKHVTNKHFYSELKKTIPKRENGATKCPVSDCKFESTSHYQQRNILNHFAITHNVVKNKFSLMFPDHCFSNNPEHSYAKMPTNT